MFLLLSSIYRSTENKLIMINDNDNNGSSSSSSSSSSSIVSVVVHPDFEIFSEP